jgi:hypothetical protein
MTDTETLINANYKDTQVSFFAMRAGLEEMRDRMRSNSIAPVTLPAAMPGAANSLLYITNPSSAADVVDPQNAGNAYFDDEFCHESFAGLALSNPGATVPCPAASAPPAGSIAPYVASFSPHTNTAASLKYKWVRLTLKQNGTFPNALVDSTQPPSAPVCWDSMATEERAITAQGYASCSAAQAAGLTVTPVYLVTSMAMTPQGSRRIGQYETAALEISPPPSALALDGPAAVFNPAPSSANYFANGHDSGAAGYASSGGTGSCTPSGPNPVPAVSTGDATGQTNVVGSIPSNRYGNYTGTGTTPNVVNAGSGGTNQLSGAWSSPSQLNALVNSLADAADVSYSCGIGAPCSPSGPMGTNANPQITYVNGDFNFGSNSGAGVLIVTGTLSITGQSSFNGLILVIGQGMLTENGGGSGQFNGSVFLARTNSSTYPYAQLSTLGTPVISWNGGGSNGIQYNSCWANIGNTLHYLVLASREEMY